MYIINIGVCLSHASLLDLTPHFDVNQSDDVLLCFSSLYWLSGLIILLRGALYGATRIITTETYTPELQLRLIEQYKITCTFNSPHQMVLMTKSERISKTDLSSIKIAIVGGSKVPYHVKTEISKYLPNGNANVGYGMSEISAMAAIDHPISNKDTVGRLLNAIKIKIIDDDGNRCGINVDGEICFKTRFKFLGYYGNQQATDELIDSEGFIMTGDIGHFDEDGYLYLVDRKKDLLKYCGSQISPSEIDSYLIESPHIKAACVVGIPDETVGDLPAAVVVRADGSNISDKDIFDLVSSKF